MNCDTCQDRLLDLLYEEIEGTEAEEAKAHVDACDPCRESYEKLGFAQRMATVLPTEEPSRSLDAAILAAARQKVGAEPERSQPERARDAAQDDEGLWASILRWLTGFAASPQFVMATIMMLVVAIGLWYLPTGDRRPQAGGETVASLDHEEAAPSSTLEPAEPLELDIDERTGRLRRPGDEQGRGGRPAATLTPLDAPDKAEGDGEGELALAEPEAEPPAEVAQRRARNRADLGGEVVEGNLDSLADQAGGDDSVALRAPAREQQQRARSAPAGTRAAGSGASGSFGAEMERTEEGYAGYAPPSQQPAPSAPVADEEADMGPTAPTETTATALHMRARNYARNRSCAEAVREYQQLLRSHTEYSRTPLVLVEMADCLRQLGRLSEAHRAYARAERYRSVATRARRGRYHVEQMQRTRSRAVDEAAAEEPASAY